MKNSSNTSYLSLFITTVKFSLLFAAFNLASPVKVCSQTTPLTFTIIPYSDPDIVGPRRGMEQWHGGNDVDPSIARPDVYYRFTWYTMEPTQGNYNWTFLDGLFNACIDNPTRQKISFGIMTCFPDDHLQDGMVEFGNGNSAYPLYVHNMMVAETGPHDWKTDGSGPTTGYGSWVPNWNSPSYLSRILALNQAINNHINTTSHNNVAYKDIVNSIDIREFGAWGEWHSSSIIEEMTDYPAGTRATAATLKTIIDHHVNAFPDFPLSLMIGVFDTDVLNSIQTPPEVTSYALGKSNNWGLLGWRRDSWGATDAYFQFFLEDNDASYNNGPEFRIAIMDRWKYAPITGEPPGWAAAVGSCVYDDLERQVRLYHASSFGNANYGEIPSSDTACMPNNVRAAAKAAGYRIILEGGSISSTISKGSPFALTLNWKNVGIAPTYEKWKVTYELKNSSNVTVWSDTSSFTPKLFLPPTPPSTAANIVTDNLTIPTTVPDGNYTLNLIIKDPSGYRKPLPLAITGRNADGSYTLKSISLSGGGTTATLNGTVNLQVRPAPPNAQWQIPLQVNLYTTTNSTLANSYTVTTDQSGHFTIANITPGVYHIGVKNMHTLRVINLSQTLVAGSNAISFGTLLEGDVDNDNKVTWADTQGIANSFNKAEGDPGFNPGADLNEDNYVSLMDISTLIPNYNLVGDSITIGCPLANATIGNTTTCDGNSFNLVLSSATGTGPYNVRVDTLSYSNISVGGTILSYTPSVESMRTLSTSGVWQTNPTVTSNEDSPVELGVKFETRVDGYVKGILFYSPNNISGTYTGHLWTTGGTLLASATFTNVTASGWQQALFSTPVFIQDSTIYIASYHTAGGRYASTTGGMADGFYNGSKIIFESGNTTPGSNGVYGYGASPTFPSNGSSSKANYWVDIVFLPSVYSFKLTGITTGTGCTNIRTLQTLVVNSNPCSQGGRSVVNPIDTDNKPVNTFTNSLQQNYPNPFNHKTILTYSLAEAANVNLSVYDISGRLIKVLVNGSKQAGIYSVPVEGNVLGKGVYFYKIRAGSFTAVKKMIIQ